MELFRLSLPIFFAFFLFMTAAIKLVKKNKCNASTAKLPPGPWRLPIIGNIHQLASTVPHRGLLHLAKKHGPLMHLKLGEVDMIVVSTSEVAQEFLKTHDVIFATRPVILASRIIAYGNKNITFAPYGDYWRQLRKICTLELMSLKRVESFRPIRDEEKKNLIQWISSNQGSPINLTEKVFSVAYTITSRAAFGKKQKEQEQFEQVVKQLTEAAGGFDISDLFPSNKLLYVLSGMRSRLQRIHKEADRILGNIVAEHRNRHLEAKTGGIKVDNEDFVDVLLKYEQDSSPDIHLTTDNIKAVLLDIYAGGSETTASTVDWAMAEMIKNPRVMEKAQDEVRKVFDKNGCVDETAFSDLDYMKLVIKETLRLHPPVPLLLPRETREKCEINGYEIPFKSRVLINAWAIGRDPDHWTDAERFYPERFIGSCFDFKGADFEYIPFGAGRRICPGKSFGLANTELLLALLLYHFDWKLPAEIKHQNLGMMDAMGITTRRNDDLFLIPTLYQQPSILE